MGSRRTLIKTAAALALAVAAAQPAHGAVQRGCIQDDRIAAGLSAFSGNFCTANDLTFVLIGLGIQQDGCVSTSDTSNILNLRGIIENTGAATRYDAGLWISVRGDLTRCRLSGEFCTTDADCSGGQNTCVSTARWGQCSREIAREPAYGQGNITCTPPTGGVNLTCGDPTRRSYINDDGDGCGDVRKFGTGGPPDCGRTVDLRIDPTNALCATPDGAQDQTVFDFDTPVVLPCVDRDADGFMEIPTCTSWGQNAADIACPAKACIGGTRAGLQCRLAADCPLGACAAPACSICSGSGAVCASDAGCPGGQVCAGTCSGNGAFCGDGVGFGCPAGQTCVSRTCKGSGDPCATAANCPAGQTCAASSDPTCRTELAVPGTSAKCNCIDGLNSNVPVARLALSCSCAAPTTVRPGFPVTCTVTYNNPQPAACTPNPADPERFRCGASGYLRFDLDDAIAPGPANGGFAVNSVSDGGATGGTPPVINWTPRSSAGTLGIIGTGRTGSLNFTYTVGSGAPDGPITLTTTTLFDNKRCSGSGVICEQTSQCPLGQTCDLTFGTAVAQPLTTTCSLNVDATYASVHSFAALDDGGRVVVKWETAAEVGTAGFDLLRRNPETGGWERVNDRLLPAAQHFPGAAYRFVDEAASPSDRLAYALVEVDLTGKRQIYGPYEARPEANPARGKLESPPDGFSAQPRRPPEAVRRRLAEAAAPGSGRPGPLTAAKPPERDSAKAKVAVGESGLYRLGSGEIAAALGLPAAGVEPLIRSGKLALSHRGREVSWEASADRTGLQFYGQAIDSPFTSQNVYWLAVDKGRTMGAVRGPRPAPVSSPAWFGETLHLEQDLLPRTEVALGRDDDYWFWEVFASGDPVHGSKTVAIELHGVAPAAAEAGLTLHLRAFSHGAGGGSRAYVYLNHQPLGPVSWNGVGDHSATFSFAQSLLREGTNSVEISGESGIFFLDALDVAYSRLYRAEGDSLLLRGDGNRTVSVSGFSQPDVAVYELADPLAPRRVEAVTVDAAGDGTHRVSFTPASPATPYLALAAPARKAALSVRADAPSDLRNATQRADYVVITSAPLVAAAQALAEHRRSGGLEAMVVDLEDILDEFNHGIASPEAVRRFLATAYGGWQVPPRYVALVGKGSFDYRDHLGLGGNLVPPLMALTASGLVSSDNLYGDVVGNDGVPEIAVGRLPVVSPGELSAYLEKLEAYESTAGEAWRRRVLMVADDADRAGDFPADSDRLAALLPATLTVDTVYHAPSASADHTRQRILQGIDQGALLVNYVGHGGLDRLAHEGILRSIDVPSLANGERLPWMVALTCNIGFFAFPGFTSLGEELVLRQGGGAVAVWAPTGLSVNSQAIQLGERALGGLFTAGDRTLGDLVVRSLRELAAGGGSHDSLLVFNLLGDPAVVLE